MAIQILQWDFWQRAQEMLSAVRLEARKVDIARHLMGILPDNEDLMKRPAKDVQSTAGSRKTALFQGCVVYSSLADLEAVAVLWAIVEVSSWSVESLDLEEGEIEDEMTVYIVKMLMIADAHLHVACSQSVMSL